MKLNKILKISLVIFSTQFVPAYSHNKSRTQVVSKLTVDNTLPKSPNINPKKINQSRTLQTGIHNKGENMIKRKHIILGGGIIIGAAIAAKTAKSMNYFSSTSNIEGEFEYQEPLLNDHYTDKSPNYYTDSIRKIILPSSVNKFYKGLRAYLEKVTKVPEELRIDNTLTFSNRKLNNNQKIKYKCNSSHLSQECVLAKLT